MIFWPCKCRENKNARVRIFGFILSFCHRCSGFIIGAIVFSLLIRYRIFLFDNRTLLLVLTAACMLPSIVHGAIMRRYLNRYSESRLTKAILFLEGLITALGGYFFAVYLSL